MTSIEAISLQQEASIYGSAYLADTDFIASFANQHPGSEHQLSHFFNYTGSALRLQNYITLAKLINRVPVAAITLSSMPSEQPRKIQLSAKTKHILAKFQYSLLVDRSFIAKMAMYSELVAAGSLPGSYLKISQLGVLPSHRRLGYAKALVKLAIERARNTVGCEGIQVATFSRHNVDIYSALGFTLKFHDAKEGVSCWILAHDL